MSTSDGRTPLHLAALFAYLECVEYLVSRGADINNKDVDGDTALHLAVFNDHVDVVKFLLKNNADVNVTNNKGNTSLHEAVIQSDISVIVCLLTYGDFKLEIKNNSEQTAEAIAMDNGLSPVLESFKKHVSKPFVRDL